MPQPLTLIVYYDEYHTPLRALAEIVPKAEVLCTRLASTQELLGPIPACWRVREADLRSRFCNEVLTRAIKANAKYQGGYHLSAALSRALIASACVEVLPVEGPVTVVHGFAGNDQLRFETALLALRPGIDVRCVAELLGSRAQANADAFTISDNIWGRSTEAGALGDPWHQPPNDVLRAPAKREPDDTAEHVIGFERGIPISLDERASSLASIVETLNRFVGVWAATTDMIEDGFVGLKSRAVYQQPAAEILIGAHTDLERLVCSRRQNEFKSLVDDAWSRLVYEGGWFDPHRASLEAYIDQVNEWVTGDVRVAIGPAGPRVIGRRSPHALYDENAAIYRLGQDFGLDLVRGLRNQMVATAALAQLRQRGR